jgi:hypothetical protein
VANNRERKKSYFQIIPERGFWAGIDVSLPEDTIRHKDKHHPNMTDEDLNRLPAVLAALGPDNVGIPKKEKPRFGGKPMIGWAEIDGVSYALIMESVTPNRAMVSTFFKDKPTNIEKWLAQKLDKEKAVTAPAALWLAQVPEGSEFRDQPSTDNIAPQGDKGKRLNQSAFSASPNRYDRPSLDYIGSGEGAQVHGYGLYGVRGDSEARKAHVNERYRQFLVEDEVNYEKLYDGRTIGGWGEP